MKKVVLSFMCFLTACSFLSGDDEKFKNPVFNKTLYAYGRTSWNTMLTSNSISESPDDFSAPDAYIEKHGCKLLENEQDHIKYLCNVCYPELLNHDKLHCSPTIIVYRMDDDGFIRKHSFRPHEQEPFSIEHLITKP